MLIVDAHTHIGNERLFSINMEAEDLLRIMEKNKIDKALVQPQAGAPDVKKNHEDIAELAVKYPKLIYGLASFNPVTEDEEGFNENIRWAIKDLGFKGIKVHTNGFSVSPLNPYCKKIYEAAGKYSVPVMIHTGNGVPQALPSLCIPIARKYPDLKIVLAHAGGGMFACEALIVAQECPNVYLETSWVNPADMSAIMNSLNPDRIMFGTDIYQNVAPSLSIYYDGGYSEQQLVQVLGQTAIDIFRLN